MKNKFQKLNFGSLEELGQEEQRKVTGGAYGAGTPSGGCPGQYTYLDASGNTVTTNVGCGFYGPISSNPGGTIYTHGAY